MLKEPRLCLYHPKRISWAKWCAAKYSWKVLCVKEKQGMGLSLLTLASWGRKHSRRKSTDRQSISSFLKFIPLTFRASKATFSKWFRLSEKVWRGSFESMGIPFLAKYLLTAHDTSWSHSLVRFERNTPVKDIEQKNSLFFLLDQLSIILCA